MPITGGGGSGSGTGAAGRGIISQTRISGDGSPGTTDVYQFTYSDGSTSTFNVYNGSNGTDGINGTGGGGAGLAVPAPQHPLGYRVAGSRGGNLSFAALSNGTVTGSNTHRLVDVPYGAGRIGVMLGNFYCNTGPEGSRDNRGANNISTRVAVGGPNSSDVPVKARAMLHYQHDAGSAKYLDGDQTTFVLPPADAVIFDSGQSVAPGGQVYVNVYAFVSSGEKFPIHTTQTRTGERCTTSAGETDKTTSTPGSLSGNSQNGFDFLAVVDLDKLAAGMPWQAWLIGGDSLAAGNYGTAQALVAAGLPYTMIARGMEQAQEWLDFDAKTEYRRSIVSRPLVTCSYWQELTNDAALNDVETFSGTGATSWQQKQRDVVLWLKRRGITRVSWATLPANTGSMDSWATTAGQFLDGTRLARQALMQQWDAYLRSGTVLYADPAGWKLYAPPTGQGFGAGSVIADVWAPLTVMEPVDTTAIHLGDPIPGGGTVQAGYDFGGQPIMKWATTGGAMTGSGLHDDTTNGGNYHAVGVRGTLQYQAANG